MAVKKSTSKTTTSKKSGQAKRKHLRGKTMTKIGQRRAARKTPVKKTAAETEPETKVKKKIVKKKTAKKAPAKKKTSKKTVKKKAPPRIWGAKIKKLMEPVKSLTDLQLVEFQEWLDTHNIERFKKAQKATQALGRALRVPGRKK